MGIGRVLGVTAVVMAGVVGAGAIYGGWDEISAFLERKPRLEGVRKPLFPESETAPRTSTVALTADDPEDAAQATPAEGSQQPYAVAAVGSIPNVLGTRPTAELPQVAVNEPPSTAPETPPAVAPDGTPAGVIEGEEDGDVTPTLEGRM